jgi:hypothetical protein
VAGGVCRFLEFTGNAAVDRAGPDRRWEEAVATLQDVLKDLRERGEDLLSLDVVTYVGEVTLEKSLEPAADAQPVPLDDLFRMLSSPKIRANLRLVAATHRALDRDVASICCDNPTDAEQALLSAHKEMYVAAEAARTALIRLVLDTATKLA